MAGKRSARHAGSTATDARTDLTMMHDRAPTTITKHSLLIAGHRTSISLEDAFWSRLKQVASARALSVAGLVAEIDESRGAANLSSAIRVYLLEAQATQ